MEKIIWAQFFVLLVGVIFAWSNFGYELYSWLKLGSCKTGCAVGVANPFLTPCFFGAIFFTVAFVLSLIIIKMVLKV